MPLFGTNKNGNNWKDIIANFLIVFAVQIIVKLNDLLTTRELPSVFECYEIMITALVASIAFYGLNKYTYRKSDST